MENPWDKSGKAGVFIGCGAVILTIILIITATAVFGTAVEMTAAIWAEKAADLPSRYKFLGYLASVGISLSVIPIVSWGSKYGNTLPNEWVRRAYGYVLVLLSFVLAVGGGAAALACIEWGEGWYLLINVLQLGLAFTAMTAGCIAAMRPTDS